MQEEEDLEDEDEKGDELRREKRASRIPLSKIQTTFLPPLPSPTSAGAAGTSMAGLRSTFSSDATSPTTPNTPSVSGRMSGGRGIHGQQTVPLPPTPGSSIAGGSVARNALRPMLRRSKTIGGLSALAEQKRKMAFVDDLLKPKQIDDPSATGGGSENDELTRTGSQREVARAQLLRKLSGRRLQQQQQPTAAHAERQSSSPAPAPVPSLAAAASKIVSGATQESPRNRPAHLTIPTTAPKSLASSLLTPPRTAASGAGMRERTTSTSSIGSSNGALTTAGLSPGFVAARNRASVIARMEGEDNFMFENQHGDADEEDSDDGMVGNVPIQDMRRKSHQQQQQHAAGFESLDESGDEDGDDEGGGGEDDFVQMHEELQEEGDREDAMEDEEADDEEPAAEGHDPPRRDRFKSGGSETRSDRITSSDSVANAQIMTAYPAIRQMMQFENSPATTHDSPNVPGSFSIPLGLQLSGSPPAKSRRNDWPVSMSTNARSSFGGDDLGLLPDFNELPPRE